MKETSVHLLETQGWTSSEPSCPRLQASLDPGSLPEELLIVMLMCPRIDISASRHGAAGCSFRFLHNDERFLILFFFFLLPHLSSFCSSKFSRSSLQHQKLPSQAQLCISPSLEMMNDDKQQPSHHDLRIQMIQIRKKNPKTTH